MKNKFVTYDLAKELKEIGFNKPCWGFFAGDSIFNNVKNIEKPITNQLIKKTRCSTPTWEDVKEWFIEEHDIYVEIRRNPYKEYIVFVEDYIWGEIPRRDIKKFTDYKDARKEAYLKAIEIVKNKIDSNE